MAVIHCNGMADFKRRITADMKLRRQRLRVAVKKTARKGAQVVRQNVPVAFGELRDAIRDEPDRIVADAPHAAAVEAGSRPHRPPIEPLIAWVKLRGMQALNPARSQGAKHGREASRWVGARLKESESGGSLDVDAPRRVAFMIANAIAKRGTKPHRYMQGSIPAIVDILDADIRAALPDP